MMTAATSAAPTPRTLSASIAPATANAMHSSVTSRMPQPIEPNRASPRKSTSPTGRSRPRNASAPAPRQPNAAARLASSAMSAASAFARSMCALTMPVAAVRVAPNCWRRPGASGAGSAPGRGSPGAGRMGPDPVGRWSSRGGPPSEAGSGRGTCADDTSAGRHARPSPRATGVAAASRGGRGRRPQATRPNPRSPSRSAASKKP